MSVCRVNPTLKDHLDASALGTRGVRLPYEITEAIDLHIGIGLDEAPAGLTDGNECQAVAVDLAP